MHKTTEATREFIGNKITEKIVKPKTDKISGNIEEIVLPPEKRRQMLSNLRQVLYNRTP